MVEDCIQEATDFDVKGHRLDFFGVCPECKNEDYATTESSPRGDA
jgi:Fe2+ or Zn2+ uptake regulation protein